MITNGATQWMTAGSGILHIETPPEQLVVSGGLFHGVQLWVNLPAKDKMTAPRYQNLEADLVELRRPRPTAARSCGIIAGDVGGHHGPGAPTRRSPSPTPPSAPAPSCTCPGRADFNALAYVLAGQRDGRRRAAPRRARASSPCSATATRSRSPAPAPSRWRSCCSAAADPRADRRLRPVRDEHPGRAGADRSRTTRPAASASSPTTASGPIAAPR